MAVLCNGAACMLTVLSNTLQLANIYYWESLNTTLKGGGHEIYPARRTDHLFIGGDEVVIQFHSGSICLSLVISCRFVSYDPYYDS